MSFPQSWSTEITQTLAAELLTRLGDDPTVSEEMRLFLSGLRGDLRDAENQSTLLGWEA